MTTKFEFVSNRGFDGISRELPTGRLSGGLAVLPPLPPMDFNPSRVWDFNNGVVQSTETATATELTETVGREESDDGDRRSRRREQNRRAAVNCRRRKRERATNSLMEYQKAQCSNTELRHKVHKLQEVRDRFFRMLASHCQNCTKRVSPTLTTHTILPQPLS